jgi:threonine/homoserine/homoserine lactone efflux protein
MQRADFTHSTILDLAVVPPGRGNTWGANFAVVPVPCWHLTPRLRGKRAKATHALQIDVMPMESSLTLTNIAALAGIMLLGALVPGVSVLAVSARSAAFGFAHGVLTSVGIVVGDIVFILIAMYGLSVLADLMGSHFALIKYLGGAYLIWLGIVLWRSKQKAHGGEKSSKTTMRSSFMTGLLITLADQKAILFYLGFFPAFMDLSRLSPADTGIILLIAIVAVGGPKIFYAFMAERATLIFRNSKATRAINIAAGGVMVGVGVILVAKA